MAKAARAIIIEDNKVLVMHRNKYGNKYYTLVGGRVNDNETLEDALVREVREETGLDVIKARLVFFEEHPSPYNEQYIYLCEVTEHESIAIQDTSEEALMNKLELTTHEPMWVDTGLFSRLPFRTVELQKAIVNALKKGFPKEPVKL